MSTEALFWALRDGTLALCYGNLEQVQPDTFQAKRYPALGEEITTPVLQIGLEDERPESVKLEPVEWDSGKSGWRGFSRTRWGKLRVNLTLIEQKDRLRRLVDDPRVEVRRTAVWALGRTADLRLTPYLIRALRDPDLSVVVEARNSLCALSRLTRGQGMPASPLAGVSEDATADERAEAIQQWRNETRRRWEKWYLESRAWPERDDLFELRSRAAAKKAR